MQKWEQEKYNPPVHTTALVMLSKLNKSLEIDRDLGGTYLYLGMIFRDQGNLEKAKSELEKATTLIHPIREYWELLIAEQTLSDLETQ